MEPKQIITQLVGTAAALLLIRWGWTEFRRDWKERRLPLVSGPYMGGRTVLISLGTIAALVPIFMAIMAFELVPKGSPLAFFAMLSWLSLGFVFVMMGVISLQARRAAKGWLTLVGDDTVRVEADGSTATLKLRPGAARLRFVAGGVRVQYVQLDLDDGTSRAHVWGMIGVRSLNLVLPEQLPRAEGLMLTSSMSPLCRWLAPYLQKR